MTTEADIAITAMCMWEEFLSYPADHPSDRLNDAVGACQMRDELLNLARQCHDDWEAVSEDFDGCFDWDFVPQWMAENIDWSGNSVESRPRPAPLQMFLGSEA